MLLGGSGAANANVVWDENRIRNRNTIVRRRLTSDERFQEGALCESISYASGVNVINLSALMAGGTYSVADASPLFNTAPSAWSSLEAGWSIYSQVQFDVEMPPVKNTFILKPRTIKKLLYSAA